jgi:hypothetical protein
MMGYGDESLTDEYRLDSVQLLQLDLYNTPAQLELDVVQSAVENVFSEIWQKDDPRAP